MGFNKLSDNNIQLRKEKSELGAKLGARTAEKAAVEKELEKMKSDLNITEFGLKQKLVSTPRPQHCFRILPPASFVVAGRNPLLHLQETCEKKTVLLMTPRRIPPPLSPPLLTPSST